MVKVLSALFALSIAAVGAYGWINGRGTSAEALKLVDVSLGDITETAVAVGQIEPRVEFHVKSKVSGIVQRCAVEVGDTVEAGEVLFDIVPDPTPVELIETQRQLESARVSYNLAKAEFDRTLELGKAGILAQGEIDARRQAFEQARIGFEQAEDFAELSRKGRVTKPGAHLDSVIRAPAKGTLLQRSVDPGDPVVPLTSYQAGTELATIADMSDMIFKGTVDEIDVGKLEVGFAAELKIGALPQAKVTGIVSRIAPQAIERDNARLFEVEIVLDPTEAVLRAGYSATAKLVIREKKGTLLIPERLVLFEDQGRRTFVEVPAKTEGGDPDKVKIETGLSDGLNIEVVEGLQEGDQIVERPPRELAPAF